MQTIEKEKTTTTVSKSTSKASACIKTEKEDKQILCSEEKESQPSTKSSKKPPKDRYKKDLGDRGERAAVRFLERQGYEILECNWVCKAGEADIIARDESTLVFIEVKTRSNCDKGLPEEAVGAKKRKRYEKIAISYLRENIIHNIAVRFDVIAILVVSPDRAFLRHHLHAFSIGD